MESLSQQLTKTIKIEIIPTSNEDIREERIWAINWFNYKNKWLYTLYNRLASPHVIKVGGQLLFKGHLERQLMGSKDLGRETLLIVTYPKISDFLEMLSVKAFQVKSLLRVKSVKDFVFGFTKRMDSYSSTEAPKLGSSDSYLVYHYQGKIDTHELDALVNANGGSVYFHGEKMAQLKRIEEGKDDVLAPFFMDGIILFKFDDDDATANFVANSWFQQQNMLQNAHYAGIFARIR